MKFLFYKACIQIILLVFLMELTTCNCIIGGFWKSVKNHPYLVVVAYEVPIPCSGTIIMSSWILTAARCIHHGHVGIHGVIGIRVGVTNFDKDKGSLVRKRTLHVHPHFMSDASYDLSVNDIGLIQLVKHLEFGPHVHPVGVSFQHVLHNASCLTMGWGIISPNVYLTGKINDPAFWPRKGENSLRDIEQQIDHKLNGNVDLPECKRVLRRPFRDAIDQDFHICAIHYPFAADPFADPTAKHWDKPGFKRSPIYYKLDKTFNASTNKPLKRQLFNPDPKEWVEYHDVYLPNYPLWYNVDVNWYWWTGYKRIRINTDGPSYYDYGGPLMCYGQQVGIFIFPVANVQMRQRYHYSWMWPPAARAVYTLLLRYHRWIDTVIEIELNRQENNPPAKPDDTYEYTVWDMLNRGKSNYCNRYVVIFMAFLVFFIH